MNKMRVNLKPLSVNEAWVGRRFKTRKYKTYERDMLRVLPALKIPEGPLQINLTFGLSSAGGDWDNPLKPFIDCLQKKYAFNDNRIKLARVEIVATAKGNEFAEFQILPLQKTEAPKIALLSDLIDENQKHDAALFLKALILREGTSGIYLTADELKSAKSKVLHCLYSVGVSMFAIDPNLEKTK